MCRPDDFIHRDTPFTEMEKEKREERLEKEGVEYAEEAVFEAYNDPFDGFAVYLAHRELDNLNKR